MEITDIKVLAVPLRTACALIGVERSKLYAMLAAGELEACKIGRKTVVTQRSLEKVIAQGVEAARQIWPAQ